MSNTSGYCLFDIKVGHCIKIHLNTYRKLISKNTALNTHANQYVKVKDTLLHSHLKPRNFR